MGLEEENRKLRERVAALGKEVNYYQEMYLEGMRLRKLLALKGNVDCPSVVGRVIGINRSSVFKTILINIGTTDGIRLGSPVLIDEGIIGRVIETSWNVSRVLLLIDYNSNIDALIQGTIATLLFVILIQFPAFLSYSTLSKDFFKIIALEQYCSCFINDIHSEWNGFK